jgi:hypothetical protein
MAEINAVDTSEVTIQAKVGVVLSCRHCPNFNGSIERCRCKHISIFGVDAELHDIMLVVIERIDLIPVVLPAIHHNPVIVTTTKHVWESWMHHDVTDEIGVLT